MFSNMFAGLTGRPNVLPNPAQQQKFQQPVMQRGLPQQTAGGTKPGAPQYARGGPDYTWVFWGEKAQNNGYSTCTALAGYPDVYTYSGNTITLDKQRGQPWLGYGLQFSLTKPGGGYVTGNLSYGTQKNFWAPAQLANNDVNAALCAQIPRPYQSGEVLTAYSNSTNVDEEQIVGAMVGYGGFPHAYPRTIQECLNTRGIKPRQIWDVDCTITVAGACASGSGAAALDTASQADLWLDADSHYYIIGAQAQTGNTAVKNQGFLQFKGNMGEYWNYRQAAIPLLAGPAAEPLSNNPFWACPFEPIGPFKGDAVPSVGGCATVAGVYSFALCVVKV